jgi:hypothetical protein
VNKKVTIDPVEELESIGDVIDGQVRCINEDAYYGTKEVWNLYELVLVQAARRLEPSHTLALSRDSWFRSAASISLDSAQAISFLTGESLRGLEQSATTEWTRMMWNGRPIGWGRYSQGQLKNHLPTWARTTGLKPK